MVLLKIDCVHRCVHTLNLVPGYLGTTAVLVLNLVYTRVCTHGVRAVVPYRYDRSTAVVSYYVLQVEVFAY